MIAAGCGNRNQFQIRMLFNHLFVICILRDFITVFIVCFVKQEFDILRNDVTCRDKFQSVVYDCLHMVYRNTATSDQSILHTLFLTFFFYLDYTTSQCRNSAILIYDSGLFCILALLTRIYTR